MKKQIIVFGTFTLFIFLISLSCQSNQIVLFNGTDLSGWKLFVADSTVNVNEVWSVKHGVIHCKGVPNGYIKTDDTYADYILELDWRWVEKESNSGVLLHAYGPDQIWPNCIECQLKAGNAGDFVLIGDESITVQDSVYANNGTRYVIVPKMNKSNEKPAGEWNHYKIICQKDNITCYVNGVLQNKGGNASRSSGSICLQSEGASIEFRHILLTPLS